MTVTRNHSIVPFASRRAVSLLELTGCILAVGVGVWLGARYLGLNLHAAAYTAMTETHLMESLPQDWRLAPPPGLEPLTPEQESVALGLELERIRHEVAQLGSDSDTEADNSAPLALEKLSNMHPELLARRQHTLAFWSQLGGIRDEVDRLQASAEQALNQRNVFQVLEIRRRAYAYGAKAVELAMTDQVDPQALQFAEQLVGWYEHGSSLYAEAINVWQGQTLSTEGLTSDQLLDQVQRQHDNEAMLLFQKSGRLCEVLFRRYQVAFPTIEEPTGDVN